MVLGLRGDVGGGKGAFAGQKENEKTAAVADYRNHPGSRHNARRFLRAEAPQKSIYKQDRLGYTVTGNEVLPWVT